MTVRHNRPGSGSALWRHRHPTPTNCWWCKLLSLPCHLLLVFLDPPQSEPRPLPRTTPTPRPSSERVFPLVLRPASAGSQHINAPCPTQTPLSTSLPTTPLACRGQDTKSQPQIVSQTRSQDQDGIHSLRLAELAAGTVLRQASGGDDRRTAGGCAVSAGRGGAGRYVAVWYGGQVMTAFFGQWFWRHTRMFGR